MGSRLPETNDNTLLGIHSHQIPSYSQGIDIFNSRQKSDTIYDDWQTYKPYDEEENITETLGLDNSSAHCTKLDDQLVLNYDELESL